MRLPRSAVQKTPTRTSGQLANRMNLIDRRETHPDGSQGYVGSHWGCPWGSMGLCACTSPRVSVGDGFGWRWQWHVGVSPRAAAVLMKSCRRAARERGRILPEMLSMMDEPHLNLPRADFLFSRLRGACLYHRIGGSWCSTPLYHAFQFNWGISSFHDLIPSLARISSFPDVFFKPVLAFHFTLENRLLMRCH